MTPQQLDADSDRHNWLTEQDWRLLHFTAGDVYRRWEPMVAHRSAPARGSDPATIMVL